MEITPFELNKEDPAVRISVVSETNKCKRPGCKFKVYSNESDLCWNHKRQHDKQQRKKIEQEPDQEKSGSNKMILELPKDLNDMVIKLSKKNNIYKVDIIRKLLDVITDMSGDINIIAYDNKNLKILTNFQSVHSFNSNEIQECNISCRYSKESGVTCEIRYVTEIIFGNKK